MATQRLCVPMHWGQDGCHTYTFLIAFCRQGRQLRSGREGGINLQRTRFEHRPHWFKTAVWPWTWLSPLCLRNAEGITDVFEGLLRLPTPRQQVKASLFPGGKSCMPLWGLYPPETHLLSLARCLQTIAFSLLELFYPHWQAPHPPHASSH